MWRTLVISVCIGLCALSLAGLAGATDRLYRCEDGTFTNRAERRCALYQSTGVVIVLPEGETLRSASARIGKRPPTCRRARWAGSDGITACL